MAKPHEVLGVAPSATRDEVRAAYRRLAARYHPDREGGDAEQFHRITVAHDALMAKLETDGLFGDIFSHIAKLQRER